MYRRGRKPVSAAAPFHCSTTFRPWWISRRTYRLLPESESRSNLRPEAFCGSFGGNPSGIGRVSDLTLSSQGTDVQRLQIGCPAWEPPVLAKEPQLRCKRQPVFPVLGHYRSAVLGVLQGPLDLLPWHLSSFRAYASSIASPRCLQGSMLGPWLGVSGAGIAPA